MITATAEEISLREAAEFLSAAKRVVAFTGAGMSAESGILTFRDPEVGIWKNRLALLAFGHPYGWRWFPRWAWSYYLRFHDPIQAAQPNAGHRALAGLAAALRLPAEAVSVVTQNVDYLHQRAGSPPTSVCEVHGSVFRHRCIREGHAMAIRTDSPLPRRQPTCPACGSGARPDATLFHEGLPEDQWAGAVSAVRALRPGDVLLVVGTSGSVYPAASLPGLAARGVVRIEVNPVRSAHTEGMDVFVGLPSAEALPRMLELATEMKFKP